ncbi:unnamed protein product, partial [Durusdinium trenchii]
VLGVLRGRLVIGFHPRLEAVNVFANQTKLKPLKDNKWLEQDCRAGRALRILHVIYMECFLISSKC